MWRDCWPLYDDPSANEEFVSTMQWSVPGVGEVGVAGQLLWLKANKSAVVIRFSDTYEEREGHEGRDLPEACLVLSGGVLHLTTHHRYRGSVNLDQNWRMAGPRSLGEPPATNYVSFQRG